MKKRGQGGSKRTKQKGGCGGTESSKKGKEIGARNNEGEGRPLFLTMLRKRQGEVARSAGKGQEGKLAFKLSELRGGKKRENKNGTFCLKPGGSGRSNGIFYLFRDEKINMT